MDYKSAWDYQEVLLQENVRRKSEARKQIENSGADVAVSENLPGTEHYLLFVEHPPVLYPGKKRKYRKCID